MLIAQITDLHLGFEAGKTDEDNRLRLDSVIARLIDGPNRPDLLIASGDLTDRGDAASYAQLAEALAPCPFPIHYALGNHDDRTNFAAGFPDRPLEEGFAHTCVSLPGLRLVLLDTLEPGRHGGGFCERRAAWLVERLREDRSTPTVIVLHHPPFRTGIAWMDPKADDPWIVRLSAALSGFDQVIALWCGHMHRPIVTAWAGVPLSIGPATAAELTLDLREIDPDSTDDRSMVVDGPPAYALHRWEDGRMVTLFDSVSDHRVLARYTDKMRPLVQQLADER